MSERRHCIQPKHRHQLMCCTAGIGLRCNRAPYVQKMKLGAEVEFSRAGGVVIRDYNPDAAFRQLARLVSQTRLVVPVKSLLSIPGKAAFVLLVSVRRITVNDIAGFSLVHDFLEIIAVQLCLLQALREPQQSVLLKIRDPFWFSVGGIAFTLPVGSIEPVEPEPVDVNKQCSTRRVGLYPLN